MLFLLLKGAGRDSLILRMRRDEEKTDKRGLGLDMGVIHIQNTKSRNASETWATNGAGETGQQFKAFAA